MDIAGDGGGYSALEPMPAYQRGVSGVRHFSAIPYLTPTNYLAVAPGFVEPTAWSFTGTPSIIRGTGTTRAVPDLSTNADPETGYLLYVPSYSAVGLDPLQGGGGGTSFVAPQFAGTAAVINSALGHRVGFWNPALYRTASSSAVRSLNATGSTNDNLYYTGTAGTDYNPAVGLGVPNFAKVAQTFRSSR